MFTIYGLSAVDLSTVPHTLYVNAVERVNAVKRAVHSLV